MRGVAFPSFRMWEGGEGGRRGNLVFICRYKTTNHKFPIPDLRFSQIKGE